MKFLTHQSDIAVMPIRYTLSIILSTSLHLLVFSAFAQELSIVNAGEIELETDEITAPGSVTKYFGMYISGFGGAMLQVGAGGVTATEAIMLRESTTTFVSYLFASFARDLGSRKRIFKRGLLGSMTVSLLDTDGVLVDSVELAFDIKGSRRFCGKRKNGKKKRCTQPAVNSLTASQQLVLAEEFVASIRGPIYLEPKSY